VRVTATRRPRAPYGDRGQRGSKSRTSRDRAAIDRLL
jgi:hypothetical protein